VVKVGDSPEKEQRRNTPGPKKAAYFGTVIAKANQPDEVIRQNLLMPPISSSLMKKGHSTSKPSQANQSIYLVGSQPLFKLLWYFHNSLRINHGVPLPCFIISFK
jgi:hypothetical protein